MSSPGVPQHRRGARALGRRLSEQAEGPRPNAPVVVEVPMPPRLTNSERGRSRHWRALHREKTEYWQTLDLRQLVGLIPPPPRTPWRRVSIRAVMFLGAAMDDDNALARTKWAVDWLKTRGYLADDRKRNVWWDGLPDQVVKRDGNYRIVLTITPEER